MRARRLALICVFFSACGGGAPQTVREFSVKLNELQCEARFTCCAATAAAMWTDRAACRAAVAAEMATKLANVEADIASGAARYDAAAGQKVLDTGYQLIRSCSDAVDVRGYVGLLDAIVVGSLPAGSVCRADHVDCAAGVKCESGVCALAATGTAPDGATCAESGECRSSRCESGRCATVTVADALCHI